MRLGPVVARGGADPDVAWERYARPALWPTWSPQIRRVECDAERLRAGARGRVHSLPPVSIRFVVDAVDESDPADRWWSWTVVAGPVTVHLRHAVQRRPDGCATTLELDGPLPAVLPYAPLAWVALRRLVTP